MNKTKIEDVGKKSSKVKSLSTNNLNIMESTEQKIEVSQKYAWESNVPLVVFLSLIVGVLSGLVSWFVGDSTKGDISTFFLFNGMGLCFGIITLPWFLFVYRRENTKLKKIFVSLFWIIGSFLSYFLAAKFQVWYSYSGNEKDLYWFSGGFIGALIVAITFHFLFKKLTLFTFFIICFVGSVIPFTLSIITGKDPKDAGMWLLYIVWQGVITALLGYAAVRKETPSDLIKK